MSSRDRITLPRQVYEHVPRVSAEINRAEMQNPVATWRALGKRATGPFIKHSAARVAFPEIATERLRVLNTALDGFIALSIDRRKRYSNNNQAGYREEEKARTIDPDTGEVVKDKNPSWIYFDPFKRPDKMIPHRDDPEISPLLAAMDEYYEVTASYVAGLLEGLSEYFGREGDMPFRSASHLQANLPLAGLARRLEIGEDIQGRHQDGTLLTAITTTDPGLVHVASDGTTTDIDFEAHEMLLMPGDIMTAMTAGMAGGPIEPFWHKAIFAGDYAGRNSTRDRRSLGRKSIMLFVSPDPDENGLVYPFAAPRGEDPRESAIRIGEMVIKNPADLFDQPEDFVG